MLGPTKFDYEKAKSLKVGEIYAPKGLFGGELWTRVNETTVLYSSDNLIWTPKTDNDFRNLGD
jgi:hypothetical protein